MPTPGDHYRPTTGTYPPGVYRVVGASGDVALLRVADGEGRREHAGDLRRVPPAELREAFEPAADPDERPSPVRIVGNQLSGLYWSVRRFL